MDKILQQHLTRPTAGDRRGFLVRMKLFHHRQQQHHHQRHRHYRWLLCLSLSLYLYFYLLSSYHISNDSPRNLHPGPSRLRLVSNSKSSRSSRSLFESVISPPVPRDGVLGDFKVYVYDLPPRFNSDWLSTRRCSTHLFAAEVAIHRALLSSDVRTFDPHGADFFFVPVYVSCNFSTVNGFPAMDHARSLMSSAVELISSEHPFWNRSRGSDHVFVASHDYGACFHAMEDRAVADGIPEFLKNSIILQTFGVNYKHPCQDVENVVIPPYIPPESVRWTLEKASLDGWRDIWVFFRGKMEVHPKNISGRFYSKTVRSVIWHTFNRDRRFYLKRHRFAGYQSEIARSVFCLCPLGWAPWSPRLVESVVLGCVPVIIADGIRLPFPDAVPWPEISLTVAERDVGRLDAILEHVTATNLTAIQRNLRDPNLRRALLFNERLQYGDATWQALRSLTGKLDGRAGSRGGLRLRPQ